MPTDGTMKIGGHDIHKTQGEVRAKILLCLGTKHEGEV